MDFSEKQLEMIAICSDGLVFRENSFKPNSEETEQCSFVTIFEPINHDWLTRTVKTSEKSEKDNAEIEEVSKDSIFNTPINNIDVFLTIKGHSRAS